MSKIKQISNSLFFNKILTTFFILTAIASETNSQTQSPDNNILALHPGVIPLIQAKAFYTQTWFIVVAGIFFLVAGPAYHRFKMYILKRSNRVLEERVAERTALIQRQADELHQLEQMKTRFCFNLSHELRTPISLVLGPLDKLMKQDHLREDDKRLLEIVEKNGRHLLELVNEILDISRLEAGKMEIRESAFNLYHIVNHILLQHSSLFENNAIKLNSDFRADESLNILYDRSIFYKVVYNYLSNALKYTPRGGEVILVTEDLGDRIRMTVTDNGVGIHPEDLPFIFDRFYQSERADAPGKGGIGIGLALVRELSQLSGGEVWAESKLGQGSSFYFLFPKKIAEPSLEAEEEMDVSEEIMPFMPLSIEAPYMESVIPAEMHRKAGVLVVEDNSDLREYLKMVLKDYDVSLAENGKVAMEILEHSSTSEKPQSQEAPRIDLILSDVMMPVMNGFQLLEWVKGKDEFRHLPFIMLTARGDSGYKMQALRVGVDDYLAKPFVEEELIARIRNLLDNYRRRLLESLDEQHIDTQEGPLVKPVMRAADSAWLEKVEGLFIKDMRDKYFKIDWVAYEMNLSERQFSRRLKELTGLSPNSYLREIRLQKARDLLHEGRYRSVKEVCLAVGFQDVPYFSGLFKERFGVTPSKYLKSKIEDSSS